MLTFANNLHQEMKISTVLISILLQLIAGSFVGCNSQSTKNTMELKKLSKEEERVILYKGTEAPYIGEYYKTKSKGTYHCKQCNAPLYNSESKFESNCGWPSFDDEIDGAVKRTPDIDGERIEITCANCGGHLGHVFLGEGFTQKNTRHCVNSISMVFVPNESDDPKLDTAVFAGGCFWGVQYYFNTMKGVVSTISGYTGGFKNNPTYEEVCSHETGHVEAVQVIYNSKIVSYEQLAKLFFEIHDFSQIDRQGPDVGEQYRTEIFYFNESQKDIATKLIEILKSKSYTVATKLTPYQSFWPAEKYHQDYYERKGGRPYCHFYKKIF